MQKNRLTVHMVKIYIFNLLFLHLGKKKKGRLKTFFQEAAFIVFLINFCLHHFIHF